MPQGVLYRSAQTMSAPHSRGTESDRKANTSMQRHVFAFSSFSSRQYLKTSFRNDSTSSSENHAPATIISDSIRTASSPEMALLSTAYCNIAKEPETEIPNSPAARRACRSLLISPTLRSRATVMAPTSPAPRGGLFCRISSKSCNSDWLASTTTFADFHSILAANSSFTTKSDTNARPSNNWSSSGRVAVFTKSTIEFASKENSPESSGRKSQFLPPRLDL